MAGSSVTLSIVVVVSLFVWPGFLSVTHCVPANGTHETVNGRTYCIVALTFPTLPSQASYDAQCHNTTTDHTISGPATLRGILGFTFRLNLWVNCTLGSGMNVTIVEPNESAYTTSINLAHGSTPNGTYVVTECLSTWITPDDAAGISCNTTPQTITASALIESGK